MGLAASSARKYMLQAQILNIQFDLQQMTQARLRVMGVLDRVMNAAANLDPNSAAYHYYEQFVNRLHQQDKRFQLLKERLEKQHEAMKTESESLNKLISEGIKQNFSYLGAG